MEVYYRWKGLTEKELKATDMSRLKLQYKNCTFYITRNGRRLSIP